MYPLFESIAIIRGVPRYLFWHQKRMEHAFRIYYNKPCSYDLQTIFCDLQDCSFEIAKARFLYNDSGYEIDCAEYIPRKVETLKIVQSDDLNYSLKYTNREPIEKLYTEKEKCDDILIVKEGLITDTSYSNIVFYNGERWNTPLKPLLEGTMRNRLIKEGKISPVSLGLNDIKQYQSFKLINAMLDFESGQSLPIENIKF